MNDRELLEFAAKAADISGDWGDIFEYHNGAVDLRDIWILDGDDFMPWNPLTDDGDALRLAVKLCLFNGAEFYHFRSLERFGGQDSDDLTATRRAIVRAAAEIGRKME